MVQLNDIKPKTKFKTAKRVGRGGKRGKTSGRGHKGQHQHGGHGIRPEMRDLIKKLPKLRGFGNNRSRTVNDSRIKYLPVALGALNSAFSDGDNVTLQALYEKGLVEKRNGKIKPAKILSTGEITKKLTVSGVKISKSAKEAIEKAGGTVTE